MEVRLMYYWISFSLLSNLFLLGLILYLLKLTKEERQDLYNRLMAGSLSEFKDMLEHREGKPPPKLGNSVKRAFSKHYAQVFGGDD